MYTDAYFLHLHNTAEPEIWQLDNIICIPPYLSQKFQPSVSEPNGSCLFETASKRHRRYK